MWPVYIWCPVPNRKPRVYVSVLHSLPHFLRSFGVMVMGRVLLISSQSPLSIAVLVGVVCSMLWLVVLKMTVLCDEDCFVTIASYNRRRTIKYGFGKKKGKFTFCKNIIFLYLIVPRYDILHRIDLCVKYF